MFDETNAALNWPIKRLGLRERLADRLRDENITTVRELTTRSSAELMSIRWVGDTYLAEVRDALAELGLGLRSNGPDESETAPKLSTQDRLIALDAKVDAVLDTVRRISVSITANSTLTA